MGVDRNGVNKIVMYSSSRRYRKNDWWDLVTVIEQELQRSESIDTYYYIADELKWRIVESISEGGNFKIRNKAQELKNKFLKYTQENTVEDVARLNELVAIFDFILVKPKDGL